MLYESMSTEEIENVRKNYSKAKDSEAWKNSPGEMYRKTVIRRLSKYIEKDFDKVEQVMAYDEGGGVEFQNGLLSTSRTQAALPDNGAPVDVMEQIRKAQAQKQEKQPVSATQREYEEEFMQFEQQQGYGNAGSYDPGFVIPDKDDELPFM